MTVDDIPTVMEGWRCFRCGRAYPLGTPRCPPCAAQLAQVVAELRALRTGVPSHLTTFHPAVGRTDVPQTETHSVAGPGTDDLPPRIARLVHLLAAGHRLTGDSVAALFGCSTRTGRRLLAEAHQAHIRLSPDS